MRSPVVATSSRVVPTGSRVVAKTSPAVEMRALAVAKSAPDVPMRPADEDSTVLCCIASPLCLRCREPGGRPTHSPGCNPGWKGGGRRQGCGRTAFRRFMTARRFDRHGSGSHRDPETPHAPRVAPWAMGRTPSGLALSWGSPHPPRPCYLRQGEDPGGSENPCSTPMNWRISVKQMSIALAMGSLLLVGSAFAAPQEAYKGQESKKTEATQKMEKGGDKKSDKKGDKKAKEDEKKDPMSAPTFAGLELRNIGPSVVGGRIVDIAVDPASPSTWYVAVASGGVWKTTNAGTTWSADLRRPGLVLHRLRHHRSQEPAGGLGRHGREQQPAQRLLRRRRLQVDGRRQELGEHGAQEVRAHRQDRHRSARLEHRLRGGPGPALGAGRRPRPLQDHGRRQDLEGRPHDQREHRRHRRGDGPAQSGRPLRLGLPAAPARLDADQRRPRVGASTSRPTAARPGRSSPAGCPGRPRPHRPRHRARRSPDMVYAIVEAARQGGRLLPLDGRRRRAGRSGATTSPAARSTTRRSSPIPKTPTASTRWTCSCRSRDDGGKTLRATWAKTTSTWTTTRSGSTRANTEPPARRLRRRPLRDLGPRRHLGLPRRTCRSPSSTA